MVDLLTIGGDVSIVQRSAAAVLGFIFSTVLLAGCSGSSEANLISWKDPSAAPGSLKKVFVVTVHEEIYFKAKFERNLQTFLKQHGVDAVASVDVVKTNEKMTRDFLERLVAGGGYDAVIVSRVTAATDDITIASPSYSVDQAQMKGFYAMYDVAYTASLNPTEIRTSRVSIETVVYGVAKENRIWVGHSNAMRYQEAPELIDDVSGAVAAKLAADGLLPK